MFRIRPALLFLFIFTGIPCLAAVHASPDSTGGRMMLVAGLVSGMGLFLMGIRMMSDNLTRTVHAANIARVMLQEQDGKKEAHRETTKESGHAVERAD